MPIMPVLNKVLWQEKSPLYAFHKRILLHLIPAGHLKASHQRLPIYRPDNANFIKRNKNEQSAKPVPGVFGAHHCKPGTKSAIALLWKWYTQLVCALRGIPTHASSKRMRRGGKNVSFWVQLSLSVFLLLISAGIIPYTFAVTSIHTVAICNYTTR